MTNLLINRGCKVTLNGNVMSGETYKSSNYIKAYLGGKFDGATKTWTVDVEKVNYLISKNAIRVDDTAPVAPAKIVGTHTHWVNRDGSLAEDF